MATVEDAFQLNHSPPQGRGGGTTVEFPEASVAELWGFALVVGEDAPFTEQHTHKLQFIAFYVYYTLHFRFCQENFRYCC